jgi:hypothetical protein
MSQQEPNIELDNSDLDDGIDELNEQIELNSTLRAENTKLKGELEKNIKLSEEQTDLINLQKKSIYALETKATDILENLEAYADKISSEAIEQRTEQIDELQELIKIEKADRHQLISQLMFATEIEEQHKKQLDDAQTQNEVLKAALQNVLQGFTDSLKAQIYNINKLKDL